MKNLVLLTAVCLFTATSYGVITPNLITDGDFSDSLAITSLKSNKWQSNKQGLDTWYSWQDNKKHDFYTVSNGHAEVNRTYWDDSSSDVKSIKLMQVISGVNSGAYNLSFDYQITNDKTQYSVFRVFGIDAGTDGIFDVSTTSWDIGISGGSATRLYDQGGQYSYLKDTIGWTNISETIDITRNYDYLVVYAAFSYDGSSCSQDLAGLDNVYLSAVNGMAENAVPEPATVAMMGIGALGLLLRQKRRA